LLVDMCGDDWTDICFMVAQGTFRW